MFFMKTLATALAGIWLTGCVQSHLNESITEANVVEKRQYASEIAAQSPFKTVEIPWSEAGRLMERRNRTFVTARKTHQTTLEKQSEAAGITKMVGSTVTGSFGEVLKPGALIESFRDPSKQLPRQFASLSRIKDISHTLEQTAWTDASTALDAELAMRRERVKLHQLLRTGDLLDAELRHLQSAPAPPAGADPALLTAIAEWRAALQQEREAWLTGVRDLFDAEYHDVRFIRDASGLPTYRDVEKPDLADADRWCRLSRSKEIVDVLGKSHAADKSAIPGASLVTNRLGGMFQSQPEAPAHVRDDDAVRREARTLIQSWRNMKRFQKQAARLEEKHAEPTFATPAEVAARRKILAHRKAEIENAAVIWMMDEQCWK